MLGFGKRISFNYSSIGANWTVSKNAVGQTLTVVEKWQKPKSVNPTLLYISLGGWIRELFFSAALAIRSY